VLVEEKIYSARRLFGEPIIQFTLSPEL